MANWSNPTLTSTYTDFLGELKNRDDDLAKQFDGTTSSNLATGTIRWNSTANRWQKWSGSAWAELTGTYALTALTTTGNASIGGTLTVTGATTLATATATTPSTNSNSTAVATTAYVQAQAYAPLASPALTGTPTVPTAAVNTNTTQAASTAFVQAEIANDAPSKTGTGASGTWGISVSGNAATVTTNANLTGDVTSVGNATTIAAGIIDNADINASAAIALSKLATGALPTAITVASANIVDGTIVNADINASAAIVDTKLATISTPGKVSNSATTATSANTVSAIVARDASGNFNATSINGGPLAGFRNVIINGNPTINQRAYVSGTATSGANQYTLDRWRVVTSGQNITFTDSANVRTVTAPAGGVEQVIEGLSIFSGTYTLNWTGTATATVDGAAVAKGGNVTLTGGTNATVRFSSGTFSLAQLEFGTVATPFEQRPGTELALCQRYYEVFGPMTMMFPWGSGTQTVRSHSSFAATKRAAPTITMGSKIAGSGSASATSISTDGTAFAGTGSIQDVLIYTNNTASAEL